MPKSVKKITITLFLPADQDSTRMARSIAYAIKETLYDFDRVALARTQTNLVGTEDPDFLPSVAEIVYPEEA
jgi:hypothetical protein